MEQKPRFLIYSSKEMAVLLLLGALIAIFAFTYGVHLGKHVSPKADSGSVHGSQTTLADAAPEPVPNRQEVDSQAKGNEGAADDSMSEALRDEVTRTGVRVDTPKPVRLPKETKAQKLARQHSGEPAITAGTKFVLQLGSFPTIEEAKAIQKEVSEKGVRAAVQSTTVQGKRFFRVLSGGFASRSDAEESGKGLVLHSIVDTFVVVPNPDQK